MDDYQQKLDRERRWHTERAFRARHFLNSRLFYSPERNAFNYVFPKQRLADFMARIAQSHGLSSPRILIAPVGSGDDLPYIRPLSGDISGIDISEEAVARIADGSIKRYVGDVKRMEMFPDDHFDMVVASLFFHHFARYGFDGFLTEMLRVLKPGGHLFALEPNLLHPVCLATQSAKKVFGNISGTVEDEAPFIPFRLVSAMKRRGFRDVQIRGASFSHNRVPIWLARINNVVTLPLLHAPLVKALAWMCLFYGRK